eukprot:scaffold4811_cov69-Phaeocystis_antarctica.AAC.4
MAALAVPPRSCPLSTTSSSPSRARDAPVSLMRRRVPRTSRVLRQCARAASACGGSLARGAPTIRSTAASSVQGKAQACEWPPLITCKQLTQLLQACQPGGSRKFETARVGVRTVSTQQVPADLRPAGAEALHAEVVDETSAAQRTHRRLERGARLERAELQRAAQHDPEGVAGEISEGELRAAVTQTSHAQPLRAELCGDGGHRLGRCVRHAHALPRDGLGVLGPRVRHARGRDLQRPGEHTHRLGAASRIVGNLGTG